METLNTKKLPNIWRKPGRNLLDLKLELEVLRDDRAEAKAEKKAKASKKARKKKLKKLQGLFLRSRLKEKVLDLI